MPLGLMLVPAQAAQPLTTLVVVPGDEAGLTRS
jgi:hypothetical protein